MRNQAIATQQNKRSRMEHSRKHKRKDLWVHLMPWVWWTQKACRRSCSTILVYKLILPKQILLYFTQPLTVSLRDILISFVFLRLFGAREWTEELPHFFHGGRLEARRKESLSARRRCSVLLIRCGCDQNVASLIWDYLHQDLKIYEILIKVLSYLYSK